MEQCINLLFVDPIPEYYGIARFPNVNFSAPLNMKSGMNVDYVRFLITRSMNSTQNRNPDPAGWATWQDRDPVEAALDCRYAPRR